MNHLTKTNAIRLIEAAGVPHAVHAYETADGRIDARSMSAKIGIEAGRVFKTLVTTAGPREYFVFVVPANAELNLKKAARAAGKKSIEMIPQKELLPLTGYVHGGCSPVGMKKAFPTFLEESAMLYDTICVSGGMVGLAVEIKAESLVSLIGGAFADLADFQE